MEGVVFDGRVGIQWNVTLPNFTQTISMMEASGGYVLAPNSSGISLTYNQMQMAFPALLPRGSNGNYPTTLDPLWVANRSIYQSSYKFSNVADGAYAMFDELTSQLYAFDIKTGQQMWVSDPVTTPFGVFSGYGLMIGYNQIYEIGYDGHVRAYDVQTGKLNWDFYQGSAGYETPYGSWPAYGGVNIADGKIFFSNDEHSPDADLWRGGKYIALNATTGEEIFRMSGQMHEGAISNGYFTAMNNYDGLAYAFGKGPSATTVTTPDVAVPLGTAVVIKGTVTDQSPGKTAIGIPAAGTPAISDANMSAWMEYLYQQKPMPTNVIGVPITITAVSSDGTVIPVGTTTSDVGGSFAIAWTPSTEGTYQIYANFAGTNSYGSSYATSHLIASKAPSPAPTTTPTPTSPTPPPTTVAPSPTPTVAPTTGQEANATTTYVIAAAVIIVGIVAAIALVLRKRAQA